MRLSSATETRRDLARRIVERLAVATDLRASLLAGSVALGIADEHSDVDLLNYYGALPPVERFDSVLRDLGAERERQLGAPTAEAFAASYRLEGIEIQTGGQLVAGVERRLDRVARGDVDWVTAKVMTGLLEGLPLHGEVLVREWQRRADYPEALRRREVEANLGFFPVWDLDAHLAARDAELFRRQMLLDGAFRVLSVLSALNRLYFTSFQFKRARAHTTRMALAPERLAERLDVVANLAPGEAARELRSLVEETKALVRAEMPDVDVDVPWRPAP